MPAQLLKRCGRAVKPICVTGGGGDSAEGPCFIALVLIIVRRRHRSSEVQGLLT
jgi:hypothetical protein